MSNPGSNLTANRSSFGITPPALYALLKAYKQTGSFSFGGMAFDSLAWGIANGVCDWIANPTNIVLAGVSTGVSGVGIINSETSNFFLTPIFPLVTANLEGAGVNGVLKDSLASVVTLAIVHAFTQFGGYTGICPTVSVGSDSSKVIWSNGEALTRALVSSFAAEKITGPVANQVAVGLGNGIAALVLTGFGTGKVVGVPGPTPSTGPSFSKVS